MDAATVAASLHVDSAAATMHPYPETAVPKHNTKQPLCISTVFVLIFMNIQFFLEYLPAAELKPRFVGAFLNSKKKNH